MILLSYLVTSSATVSPFSPPNSLPPILGSAIECDMEAFSQEELLSIVGKAYPPQYLQGLASRPDGGFELFYAATKVNERVSIAIARFACCQYVLSAHDGAKATGLVEFYREDDSAGAYIIPRGSVVQTLTRKEFVTTEDVIVDAGRLGPFSGAIEAITEGYEYNVLGALTTPGGELLEGEIQSIKVAKLVSDLTTQDPVVDVFLRVRNIEPTTGGEAKCLDALGQDRGMPRFPFEETEAYRYRIASTPDTVSPDAIRRGVDAILAPYGGACCLREVGTNLLPGMFYDAGASTDAVQDDRKNFAYDMEPDIRPEDRFKVWLSFREMRGFFLVGVPALIETEFAGLTYDGDSFDPYDVPNAYDTESPSASNAAYDGGSTLKAAVYKAIWDTINQRRAGGIGFDLYIEDRGCF